MLLLDVGVNPYAYIPVLQHTSSPFLMGCPLLHYRHNKLLKRSNRLKRHKPWGQTLECKQVKIKSNVCWSKTEDGSVLNLFAYQTSQILQFEYCNTMEKRLDFWEPKKVMPIPGSQGRSRRTCQDRQGGLLDLQPTDVQSKKYGKSMGEKRCKKKAWLFWVQPKELTACLSLSSGGGGWCKSKERARGTGDCQAVG